MKIIVADDEMLARETLILILEDIRPGLDVTEAKNGLELVQQASELRPDIIFVDIRMPGKSGLEAMEEALPHTPHAQWIIMTGFAEFDYARQALKLGALDYLLKPIEPSDVERIVQRAAARIGQDAKSLSREFESVVTSLWHNPIMQTGPEHKTTEREGQWTGMLLYETRPVDGNDARPEQTGLLPQAARQVIADHNSKELLLVLIGLERGEYALIGKALTSPAEANLRRLPKLLHDMLNSRSPEHPRSRLAAVLESGTYDSFEPLRNEMLEMRSLSYLRSVADDGKPLVLADMRRLAEDPVTARFGTTAVQLVRAYAEGDYTAFMTCGDKLRMLWADEREAARKLQSRLLAFLAGSLAKETPAPMHEGFDPWLEQLYEETGTRLLRKKSEGDPGAKDWLEEVVLYLEAHFCGDITVSAVAERFGVSPNHLSTLFHKRMGVTFSQYVTRLRMMKAKELLSIPGMKVNEAAEQVGYYSTRHFTNLFREYVGCYPSEFGKLLKPK